MTKQKSDGKRKADEPSFEQALADLEKIVADMEGGKLGLEDMIGHFEKGQGLVQFCTDKLNEVEHKIEVLVKKGGRVVAEPFEVEDDPGTAETEPADEAPPKDGLF